MNGREATRLTYALILLVAPDRLSIALTARRLDARSRAVARVLGTRHLLQAIVVTRSDGARQMGRVVDQMHAASMLCLAVFDSRRRRLALIDSAVASLFTLAGTSGPSVEQMVRPAPEPRARARRQDPPASPLLSDNGFLETGNARRRRRQALRTQLAIVDAVDKGKGQPVERVKRELVLALKAHGVKPPTDAWLNAVAAEATLGNIYVVDEQALAATARVLGNGDPQ